MKAHGFLCLLIIIHSFPASADENYSWRDLYNYALLQNTSLAGTIDAAKTAEYEWKSAKRSRGPVLSFESDLSYLTSPRQIDLAAGSLYPGGTLAPGLEFPALPETDLSLPLAGNEWYSFRLILEQPLLSSGKLKSQQNIYRALWESSLLETQQKELVIKAEILTIVYSLSFLEEMIQHIDEQRNTAARFVELISDSYESGMASYSDFLGAQVKAREINLTENQVKTQQNQALLHLEYLSGIKDLKAESISSEGLPSLTYETDPTFLLGEAADNSPVLKMLKQQIEASSQNVGIARGSSYGRPDFGLRLELDYAGGTIPFTSDDWGIEATNLTGSLGIRTLLGDFGKAAADVKAAQSKLSASRFEYRDQFELIQKAIGEELFNQKLSRENIEYYTSRARDDLEVAQQRKQFWEAGYGLEQDYLLQLISWYSDLIYEKQEQISLAVSYYKLKAITGILPD